MHKIILGGGNFDDVLQISFPLFAEAMAILRIPATKWDSHACTKNKL